MKEFLISDKATIKTALKKLVENHNGCLIVVQKRKTNTIYETGHVGFRIFSGLES